MTSSITQPATRHAQSSISVAGRVTTQIADMLRNGVRPWVQPWSNSEALALPLRHDGTPYRGINILVLWAAAHANQYASRRWFTLRQANALNATVRLGERATHIVFYKQSPPIADGDATENGVSEDQNGTIDTTRRRAVLRTYAVFNAAQCDNLPEEPPRPHQVKDVELMEKLERIPAHVQHGGARAFYNPATDTIQLPPLGAFRSHEHYCATRLHECAHWTGHSTRLARDLASSRSLATYAREELVAELCSAFVGAELGLPSDHLEDHASYIDYWIKMLERDPGVLMLAAARAQRAADFLMSSLAVGGHLVSRASATSTI